MRSMTVFNFLLESTLIGSALILLLGLLRPLLRRRIGSRLLYAFWLVVALRLLLPLSLPNPLMNDLRPGLSVDMQARPVADQIRVRTIDAAQDAAEALRSFTGGGTVSDALEQWGDRLRAGHTGKWVLLVYLLVAASISVYMLQKNRKLRQTLLRNRVATLEGDGLREYQRLCARFLVSPAPVYFVDKLDAPCSVGVFHPRIFLPLTAAEQRLEPVLIHQLCHLKSMDELWAAVRNLCCAVHWFNPLVWLGAKWFGQDAEMACDDRARRRLDDGERIAYAEALANASRRHSLGLCLLVSDCDDSEKSLKKRMKIIVSNGQVKPWAAIAAAALCVCVLTGSFLTGEKYAPVRITVLPRVHWHAAAESILSPEGAVAYARRFLESPYTGVDTAQWTFAPEVEAVENDEPHLWRVDGTAADGAQITLRFFRDGTLLKYDGLYQAADVNPSVHEENAPALPRALREYLQGYVKACLPNQKWVDAAFDGDALGQEPLQRVTCELRLLNRGTIIGGERYSATVELLVTDTVRVIGYTMTEE